MNPDRADEGFGDFKVYNFTIKSIHKVAGEKALLVLISGSTTGSSIRLRSVYNR
jgi:hypothetical protein